MTKESGGWDEWGKHVLAELSRLNDNIEKQNTDTASFKIWVTKEVASLQAKAGVFGVLGGITSVLVVLGVEFLKNVALK